MANYKVIFRADRTGSAEKLLWEPGCPIAFEAVQVSRNVETSQAFLQVKVRNVSGSTVSSLYGTAIASYADGTSEEMDIEELDLDLAQGYQKALKVMPLPRGDIESIDVRITQARLAEDKWKSNEEFIAFPQQTPLILSDKATTERKRILSSEGVDARTYGYVVQDNGGWWVCACGQVNVGSESCCGCGALKTLLQATEDERSLLESADELSESIYQKALKLAEDKKNVSSLSKAIELFGQVKEWKDSEEQISACKAQISKMKNQTAKVALIAVLVVIAAVVGYFLVTKIVIPSFTIGGALSMAENGDYEGAITQLKSLAESDEAAEQVKQVTYDWAFSLYEDGDFGMAVDKLISLGSYGDATEQADRINYEWALSLYEGGDYEGAIRKLGTLGSYKDAEEQRERITYEWALSLYEGGDYEGAYDTFGLTSYSDAEEMRSKIAKTLAAAYEEASLYDEAIAWYRKLNDTDSINRVECEEKYEYVKAHYTRDDLTTFEYLKELRDIGYKDSAAWYSYLYAWHVELADIFFEERNSGFDGKTYLLFKMSGGEPGGELTFHVDYSQSGLRNSKSIRPNERDDWSGSFDFTLSLEDFEYRLKSYSDGGYTRTQISDSDNWLDYELSPYYYSSLTITVSVTAGGESLSKTIVVR